MLEPVLALEVARVEPAPVAEVPLAAVSVGTTTDEPLAMGAEPVTAALVTVGTEAAGVTWIWPSEYCETGTSVVAGATLVIEAQGVVPTCTWPEKKNGNVSMVCLDVVVRYKVKLTIRDLGDLAQWDTSCGSLDLGLTVGKGANDGGGDNLCANDLAITGLRSSSTAWHDQNLDR